MMMVRPHIFFHDALCWAPSVLVDLDTGHIKMYSFPNALIYTPVGEWLSLYNFPSDSPPPLSLHIQVKRGHFRRLVLK